MFLDELDQNLHDAILTYCFGLDDDFYEIDSASKARYDVYENGEITFGGHC